MPEKIEVNQRRFWIVAWAYFIGVMLAYACVILFAKAPPAFVDYPDWVYQGFLFHGVLSGHPFAGYVLKHYPVPNSTTTIGLGLLDTVLPWQWAAKAWICLYLALATFATWFVLHVFSFREWRFVVALPAIVFLNLDFWYGHISFEIGICLVLLLLGLLKRNASSWTVSLMLVLLFFTHMEACAGAILLLVLWCVVTRRWREIWTAIPTIALTAWYVVARFSGGNLDVQGLPKADYAYGSPGFLVYKTNTFFKIFGYVNACTASGLSQGEEIFGKGLFLLLIAASLILSIFCLLHMLALVTKPGSDKFRKIAGAFVLILLVISTFLPQIWLGVADPGSRLLLLAAAVGLLFIKWRNPTGLAIAGLSALFCLVNLWQFAKVENNPGVGERPRDIPAALIRYGHVEPSTRVFYYEKLKRGEMKEYVFPTGIFRKN
ncbi:MULTISPECIES: hypothetical protein [Acidobacteriaceae]|uniref:hypothetical protein n=1 Tax=Acidobacteriaceae TaxID=204434 RepID=UPI00131E0F3C|nr:MULTISPECIES: hypothetical protein [Acidobacteriaceae]MDW5264495.1 hypothetical protein [Edaphobacter sp.]